MKFSLIQKKICLIVFGLVLGGRAVRYSYLRGVKGLVTGELVPFWLLHLFIFAVAVLAIVFSLIGVFNVVGLVLDERRKEVVSERFHRLVMNSFWTAIVSLVVALFVKILIWP